MIRCRRRRWREPRFTGPIRPSHIGGERAVEGGYSIYGVGRQALVDILASRARDAGVRISYPAR